MKRRQAIRYGVLGLGTHLTLMYYQARGSGAKAADRPRSYDWILLYWMPYDNDLWSWGSPILEMLEKGVQSDNILAIVQADFLGDKQLSRSAIARGRREVQYLETTNSASAEVFADYLNWTRSNFVAKKWAISFMGHGGRLDEISPDRNPGMGQSETRWMNIHKIAEIVQTFNQQINSQVELFFFQNCNKGTLEAHYTLRQAAKYTLSSQRLLGAPNYYYESLLQFLGRNPNMSGGQLAAKIMEFERSDMYNSYTVTENRYLQQLPEKLNPLIEQIIAQKPKVKNILDLKPYRYNGEAYVDLLFLLNYLVVASQLDPSSYEQFVDYFKHSLIYKYQQNPQKRNPNLSGLGVLLPKNKTHLETYRYLPVFSHIKLPELFNTILFEG